MVTDIPALARTLHSESASLDEKLRAAEDLSNALLSLEPTSDGVHIPALLRSHYISSLLDWLLNGVGRSSGGTGGSNKKRKNSKGSADPATKTDSVSALPSPLLWELLAQTLEHSLISPERPLPASLLANITAAVHEGPRLQPEKSQPQLFNALEKLVTLLGTKFNASFKPALEPTSALVEAALASQIRISEPGLGAASLNLLVPLLKQQPNPRKSWDAVVPRLLELLIDAGFQNEKEEEEDNERSRLAASCREALSCALFNQAHVASMADAATMVIAPKKVEKTSAKDAVAEMFNLTGKPPSRLYTSQLFSQVEKLIEKGAPVTDDDGQVAQNKNEEQNPVAGVFMALPWLVETYCFALNRYKRAAEIAASIASQAGLRLPGDGGSENSSTAKEKETRSVGGVPVDADFKFFTALTLLLQKKLNSIGDSLRKFEWFYSGLESRRSAQKSLLLALASVCSILKSSHIYRPTEDPEGKNRQWLADLVSTAIQCSTPNEYEEESTGDIANTTVSLKVLEAVLAVEHRGVQPHLSLLWSMLWSSTKPLRSSSLYNIARDEIVKVNAQEESDFLVQINVATSLIHAYSELRQLEVLLSSLAHAVRALKLSGSSKSSAAAAAAAKLITSSAVLKILRKALGNVPSGQVAALVRMVTSWIPALHPPENTHRMAGNVVLPVPLLIADLGAACLAALHIDVITAPAVADALGSLIRSLSPILSSRIGISEAGRLTALFDSELPPAGAYECTAALVMLYRQALKLHTFCCLLHPEVVALPGQELYLVNKEKQPSGGYFDAVLYAENTMEIKRPMVIDFNEETGGSLSFSSLTEPKEADIWKLADTTGKIMYRNKTPSYFQVALAMAAADRVEVLQYRKLHAQHSCDPGSNEKREDRGDENGQSSESPSTTTTTTALALLEKEILFLGKLLLGQVSLSVDNTSSGKLTLISVESATLSKCSTILEDRLNRVGMVEVVPALIFENQVVLDALLGISVDFDENFRERLITLFLTRVQKKGDGKGADNDDVEGNSSILANALSHPVLTAIAPLAIAQRMYSAISTIVTFDMELAPTKKEQKKKTKEKKTSESKGKDQGNVVHVRRPLEALLTCMQQANSRKSDQKELKIAFSQTAERLEELGGVSSLNKDSKISKKRKSVPFEHLPEDIERYISNELTDINFLLSRALLLNLQKGGVPEGAAAAGVEALVTAAIASAAAAATSLFHSKQKDSSALATKIVTKAMNFIAAVDGTSSAEAPLQSLISAEGLAFLESLLTAVPMAQQSSNVEDNARESVKIAFKKLVLDSFLTGSTSGGGDGASFLLEWVEEKTSSTPLSASLAVLLEAMMAACEEFLVVIVNQGQDLSSSSPTTGEALAISLMACFDSKVPSLSSLLAEKTRNNQILDSLAACAAHVIRIRCLAPAAVFEKMENLVKQLPSGASSMLLTRISEDVAAVAMVLTSSDTDVKIDPIFGLLRYLEAACLATGAMKPGATAEHFASLLCLCLHTLALLPIDCEHVEPVRRTIPLSAAFPAARITPSDSGLAQTRSAALGAVGALLAGSNSQQLRDVVSFVEKTLSNPTSITNPYLLPITELGLMALEATRGKAALTTLAQRAERLASALIASIYHAACPLSQKEENRVNSLNKESAAGGMPSFAALYGSFLKTPLPTAADSAGNRSGNDKLSWTMQKNSQEEFATSFSDGSLAKILACATALRALESIAARPKAFLLSSRHLARILNFIQGLESSLLDSFNSITASVFANVCHLLTACARHRESELGRCLPLFGHAVRALLIVLVKWEANENGSEGSMRVRVYCAEALAAVMAEIANLKASDKYCPHILADYLILAACPITPTAMTLLGSTIAGASAADEHEESSGHGRAKLLCSPKVGASLRQGAYAIYGACGTAGVQYVYASFGSRGSGGLWRAGLSALKADHDKSFKYTGKV